MRKLLALASMLASAACATSSAVPADTNAAAPAATSADSEAASAPIGAAIPWAATLSPRGGSGVSGTARVTPNGAGETVTVTISRVGPNSTHPWHVHSGTCATGGGVVGPASAYTPLAAGNDSSATQTTQLPARLDTAQAYHVNVHNSSTDMSSILACGDLSVSKI